MLTTILSLNHTYFDLTCGTGDVNKECLPDLDFFYESVSISCPMKDAHHEIISQDGIVD